MSTTSLFKWCSYLDVTKTTCTFKRTNQDLLDTLFTGTMDQNLSLVWRMVLVCIQQFILWSNRLMPIIYTLYFKELTFQS